MSVEAKLNGIDQFSKTILELKDAKKVRARANTAGRRAMQLVQFAAKSGASQIDDPITSESIQENIVVRGTRARDLNTVVIKVGILGGAKNYINSKDNVRKGRSGRLYLTAGSSKNPGGDTWYWRLIEFGTSLIRAFPFMRLALSKNVQRVTDEFCKTFKKSIETAIAKGKIS